MDQETLERLQKQDWPTIILQLKAYAIKRVSRLNWRRGREALPEGKQSHDLAMGAITQAFGIEGNRKWDYEKHPDLLKYLMDTVDSLVSNLVRSSEHKSAAKSSVNEFNKYGDPIHKDIVIPDHEHKIDNEILVNEIRECTKGEDDLEIIFQCLLEGMKSREIADEYGLSISQVYQLTRKLIRRVIAAGLEPKE